VLWLIPSQPELQTYVKVINRLSEAFDSTAFTPHLTVARLPDDKSSNELIATITSILKDETFVFSASHMSVSCQDTPYQNCIQNLKAGPGLELFQAKLIRGISNAEPKDEYHISLKYGYTACESLKTEIVHLNKVLPHTITFDKLQFMELAGGPVHWKNIWEQEV
jgi:hypothetical protein